MTPPPASEDQGTGRSRCDGGRRPAAEIAQPGRLSAVRRRGGGTGHGGLGPHRDARRMSSAATSAAVGLFMEAICKSILSPSRRCGRSSRQVGSGIRKTTPPPRSRARAISGAFSLLVRESESPPRRIEITADNGFQAWINGRTAVQGVNFHTIFEADVAALLKPGENTVAVEVSNGGRFAQSRRIDRKPSHRVRGRSIPRPSAPIGSGRRPAKSILAGCWQRHRQTAGPLRRNWGRSG